MHFYILFSSRRVFISGCSAVPAMCLYNLCFHILFPVIWKTHLHQKRLKWSPTLSPEMLFTLRLFTNSWKYWPLQLVFEKIRRPRVYVNARTGRLAPVCEAQCGAGITSEHKARSESLWLSGKWWAARPVWASRQYEQPGPTRFHDALEKRKHTPYRKRSSSLGSPIPLPYMRSRQITWVITTVRGAYCILCRGSSKQLVLLIKLPVWPIVPKFALQRGAHWLQCAH